MWLSISRHWIIELARQYSPLSGFIVKTLCVCVAHEIIHCVFSCQDLGKEFEFAIQRVWIAVRSLATVQGLSLWCSLKVLYLDLFLLWTWLKMSHEQKIFKHSTATLWTYLYHFYILMSQMWVKNLLIFIHYLLTAVSAGRSQFSDSAVQLSDSQTLLFVLRKNKQKTKSYWQHTVIHVFICK